MFKKSIVIALVLILTSVAFGGLVLADEVDSFKGNPDETYYMVTFVSGVDYWSTVFAGFRQAGEQLGVETIYTGTPEYDITEQVRVFNQVVAQRPDGIALSPISADAFIEPINNAIEEGVPVMTFATNSPRSNEIAYVTSDNVTEGETAADFLAEAIGGEGEIALLENPGQLNHEIRISSFRERIEEEWPDVEVVASYASNQNPDRAAMGVQTMSQANPGIEAVFAPEASSGMGAANAALEIERDIKVMCVDINDSVLSMIREGDMLAAIQPDTVTQGYLSMLILFLDRHQLIDPMNDWEDNPDKGPINIPYVDHGLDIVTQDNVDYFYSSKYLEERDMDR